MKPYINSDMMFLVNLFVDQVHHKHNNEIRYLALAVSAVEQLQVMASKRQYKEAAAQLEVPFF